MKHGKVKQQPKASEVITNEVRKGKMRFKTFCISRYLLASCLFSKMECTIVAGAREGDEGFQQ